MSAQETKTPPDSEFHHEAFKDARETSDFPFLAAQGNLAAYGLFVRLMICIGNGIPDMIKHTRPKLQFRMADAIFGVFAHANLLGDKLVTLMAKRHENAIRYLATMASAVNAKQITMERFLNIVSGKEAGDWEFLAQEMRDTDEKQSGGFRNTVMSAMAESPLGSMLDAMKGPDDLMKALAGLGIQGEVVAAGSGKSPIDALMNALKRHSPDGGCCSSHAPKSDADKVETKVKRTPASGDAKGTA